MPLSSRTPGPVGSSRLVILPASGRKSSYGFSALMRHSMAWPLIWISSCVQPELAPGGDGQLLLHDVDARDELGDQDARPGAACSSRGSRSALIGPVGIRPCRRWRSPPPGPPVWRLPPSRPAAPASRRPKALPRSTSDAAAEWSTRARPGGCNFRSGRPAPGSRHAAPGRSPSPGRLHSCRTRSAPHVASTQASEIAEPDLHQPHPPASTARCRLDQHRITNFLRGDRLRVVQPRRMPDSPRLSHCPAEPARRRPSSFAAPSLCRP